MDGRRLRSLLAAALTVGGLSAAGCRTTAPEPLPPATLPLPGQHKTGFLGLGRAQPQYGPVPQEPVAAKPRKPTKGVKLETEVILADTEVESAMLETQTDDMRNKLLDEARAKYQKALKADPKNKAALTGLARLYAKAGDKEKAVQTFTQAVNADPKDHETAMRLARTQAQFNDWAAACQTCEYALGLDPENRSYRKIYGYCLAQQERWEDAFAALMHRNQMTEADARYFLGRVLLDKDKTGDAQQQFDMALKADPTHFAARAVLEEMANPQPAVPDAGAANPVRNVGYDGR
jgi:tetratricopeptide (TPR) repeat protein